MKTCSVENCINPVWGKGLCRNHQWKRTDKKKSVPKFKEKPVKHIPDFGFDNQLEMFAWLWDEAKDQNGIVVCPYTKERLNRFYGTNMWLSCFSHVLSKKNWPYFKLNPEAVYVVLPEFHRIVDQGTFKQRSEHPEWNWLAWDEKVLEMKEKYIQFKRENLLR